MTPERWQQVQQIYDAALEREPLQRAAYVVEVCGGDESLSTEVQSLLVRATSSNFLLSGPGLLEGESSSAAGCRLTPGARLGPYEIEAELGAGGMGEVWRARDTRLGRVVALKVSKTEFSQGFEREARVVAALNHPHIAALYDIGPNYFVMEYVDGKPLRQLIPRKGLTLVQALNYAAQIADALAVAHAVGIVHRDLKPGNIMVTLDGRVKVVDFGLARRFKTVAAAQMQSPGDRSFMETVEGVVAGTASYMSPEQAQGRSVDARSDIFSFGAVFYEMLTGARAFQGDSPMSTLADILVKEPRPASELAESLPHDVEALLSRCLRKDPARRWQNMSDLKVALQELKEDSESGKLDAALNPVMGKRRGSPLRFAAGTLFLLLAGAAGWYFGWNRQPVNIALNAIPLTSYPGDQIHPSFSPDGSQVAFAWNGPHRENWAIYVKVVGEGEPLRLTSGPDDESRPVWSPDGRWIAYARSLPGGRYALMLISPLGGAAKNVGEFGSTLADNPGFAWTNDSKHLFFSIREEASRRNGLFRLTLETGDMHQVTRLDAQAAGDSAPALSPDESVLAFMRLRDKVVGDLYVVDLAGDWSPKGEPRLLVPDIVVGAAWTADGKDLIYPSGHTQPGTTLKRVALSGRPAPRPVPPASDGAYDVAISRPAGGAGSRLAWTHRFSDANIYRLELSGESEKAAEKGVNRQPLIDSSFRDVFPQYSPDGKSIAFVSSRSGAAEIWICQSDGSRSRQLTSLGASTTENPRWSPDGKQIAFNSNKEGIHRFYIVGTEGGSPKRMTEPPFASFAPNWSPDGREIYFGSDRGGAVNIWKMLSSGGPPEQVTRHGGNSPTVSRDGKFLYYVKERKIWESSLWRVPLESGEEQQMIPRIHHFSYALSGRELYFSVPQPTGGGTIELFDLSTRRGAVLARTDKNLHFGISVSPDARYLLFAQNDYQGANLMMIENFH